MRSLIERLGRHLPTQQGLPDKTLQQPRDRRAWLMLAAMLLAAPPALSQPGTSRSSGTGKKKPARTKTQKATAKNARSRPKPQAAEPLREPPNLAQLDERWTTAGQPSAAWLGLLKSKGFDAVLYLAPSSVGDAVADEPEIVRGQGLAFAHVPVDFARPLLDDYRAFETQLQEWRAQRLKLLVHCQLNMRASTFSFLYRVRNEGVDPETAWAEVQKVWLPLGPWKPLVQQLLAERDIAFDPF